MDAIVPVPDPADGEVQESHILKECGTCCLGAIRNIGEPLGISCQQVFERAYARAGIAGTYARAIFAQYLSFKGKGPLPLAVSNYAEIIREKGYGKIAGKGGFCAGCMLDQVGIHGYIAAYDLIKPVDLELASKFLAAPTATLSTVDALYLDLLDSGALNQENESWQDVLGISFEDPQE